MAQLTDCTHCLQMNKLLDNSTVAKQLSTASPSSPVDALSPAQRPLPSPAAQPSVSTFTGQNQDGLGKLGVP